MFDSAYEVIAIVIASILMLFSTGCGFEYKVHYYGREGVDNRSVSPEFVSVKKAVRHVNDYND